MNLQSENIIIVDEKDNMVAAKDKLSVHREGDLHRAFSVFVFQIHHNTVELLLQKRKSDKYHSADLWSNTCCSHPRPNEDILDAANRRLKEEMGLEVELQYVDKFHYRTEFENGMVENEIDHVFMGIVENKEPSINPDEVGDYKWIELGALLYDLKHNRKRYTYWLDQALTLILEKDYFHNNYYCGLGSYNPLANFSKLNRKQRLRKLTQLGYITQTDQKYLEGKDDQFSDLSDKFIENAIGYYEIPLGVAVNLNIDGRDHVVPMATEETSVIAAVSKNAKWIRESGKIETRIIGTDIIGQIYYPTIKDVDHFTQYVEESKQELIEKANKKITTGLFKRGGGVKNINIRRLEHHCGTAMVLHVLMNPCDSMGANLINQVCEWMQEEIADATDEQALMSIVSNLSDTKLTCAQITLSDVEPALGIAIEQASLFAYIDPYRAATNNKGVLNGMDAVLIATGNDWRAVEAAVHAYATRDRYYRSITNWKYHNGTLTGTLEAPIIVGTFGGVTRAHPSANMCLRMLEIQHADELARIVAAVGLVQNLAAIRALTQEGITQGHMRLHIDNLLIHVEEDESIKRELKRKLNVLLKDTGKVTQSDVKRLLKQIKR